MKRRTFEDQTLNCKQIGLKKAATIAKENEAAMEVLNSSGSIMATEENIDNTIDELDNAAREPRSSKVKMIRDSVQTSQV